MLIQAGAHARLGGGLVCTIDLRLTVNQNLLCLCGHNLRYSSYLQNHTIQTEAWSNKCDGFLGTIEHKIWCAYIRICTLDLSREVQQPLT